MIIRYWSSSKSTVDDHKRKAKVKQNYDDIEEADFKEIKEDDVHKKGDEKE